MTHVNLLDGSMGEELIQREFAKRGGLWSAYALIHHPGQVKELHKDYIRSGAAYITTNTYSTVPSYLGKSDLVDQQDRLVALAGQLAREAVSETDTTTRILGCLPPLDESYRPDRVPQRSESIPIYSQLVAILKDYVDIFIAETMSCIEEAATTAMSVREHEGLCSFPFYIAYTVQDADGTLLRSGESIAAAIEKVTPFHPEAILFNCSSAQAILTAIQTAREYTDIQVGGYPNRFQSIPAEWTLDGNQVVQRDWNLTPDSFADWVVRYVEAGAQYVGGCCGIGPEHIRAANHMLN